jgi:1,4-alpha-glucan branching enzyme
MQGVSAPEPRGELALVLHTHMPYVEGFGTWPFGEEWLWEAIATSYVPLVEVLDRGAPVTLSLTPVLCDQLEAPGALDRCLAFLRGVREESHRLDLSELDDPGVRTALRHSREEYRRAAAFLESRDLLEALAPHAGWTSAATHAVLPLLATDAGVRLQIRAGIESHRARFGAWRGGFWLPECAHVPWLDPFLEEAGVHACCVELTDLGVDPRRPLRSAAGPLLVPIDRELIDLVWSPVGYPSNPAYRAYAGYTPRHHRAWANDGAPYDPERGRAQARADAADFVRRAAARMQDGGLAVCALDTELLGHWWHEGVAWLAAVVEEAERAGLALSGLDDALERHEPAPAPALPVTSWGTPRDLTTWSGPAVAELAWAVRETELRLLGNGAAPSASAVRELLHLQASDWTFLVTRDLAGPYPRERAAAHRRRALAPESGTAHRYVVPHLSGWAERPTGPADPGPEKARRPGRSRDLDATIHCRSSQR